MNIAIFGDSFANGVTDGLRGNRHGGLVDYLKEDGHFVVNFSRQGNSNYQTIDDYAKNLRQNPHLNFDMAFVFQTETTRQTNEWIESLRDGVSIKDVDNIFLHNFYKELSDNYYHYNVPIYIVGGTNDTLSPEVISKYNGLTCICQSWTNLIDSGKHTIDEPTISFVFPLPAYSMTTDYAHLIDDKEYFLKIEKMGYQRYQKYENIKEYYHMLHPNEKSYKILYEHIKESIWS